MTGFIFFLVIMVDGGLQVINEKHNGPVAVCAISQNILARQWVEKNEPRAKVIATDCRVYNYASGGNGA
jgi:hypothetical protein